MAQANLTTIELHQLHERMMEHIVGIENCSLWLRQAQDPDLRQTLQSHLNQFQQHFQKLFGQLGAEPTGLTGGQPGGQGLAPGFPPVGQPGGNGGGWAWQPQGGNYQAHAFQADPSDTRITDPVLAASCLVYCKFESLACSQAALEAGHGSLRQCFLDVSRDHSQMALELYQLMERKGWYPVRFGPDSNVMNQVRSAYQGALRRAPAYAG
ncbi:spore coat protein [Limnochorda pilosa]|uniref:Spore coat protein n=1 Tax=Limnochorda pilosa TaxID=1555112 RepID=A0A0K2SPF7_LIMPI|nr:spore coat protein [Limnochorda pilosa]BAS29023.1 hypothetical protein LIP_3206 [Limnochorda pilosa]